jgi:hypothetical protein
MHLSYQGGVHVSSMKALAARKRSHPHVVTINDYPQTTKLAAGSLLGAMAAILQSAGFFTGVGYIFSMLTTLPIVISTVFSVRIGFMTYGVTVFLLALFQPSELIVFPFTTGLLGIGLGIGLRFFKKSIPVTLFAGFCLSFGIFLLLYVFRFPVLGPSIKPVFDVKLILGIIGFSLVYSWIWLRISITGINLLDKVILKKGRVESEID